MMGSLNGSCNTDLTLLQFCRVPPAGAHHLAPDFKSALTLVDTELADQADQVWVIGGSSLYKVLHGTLRLLLTSFEKLGW